MKKNINDYFKKFLMFGSIFFGCIFTLNYLVDPLWYFGGNKIKNTNYVFDERLSKFNLFYYDESNKEIDCFLFGSSISTTVNSNMFKKNKCFNFSFSAGGVEEYSIYLDYLNTLGFYPKKIYIELPIVISKKNEMVLRNLVKRFPSSTITGYFPPITSESLFEQTLNFKNKAVSKNRLDKIPKFILDKKSPDKFWHHYFTFNSFLFSLKSLLSISNYTNAYDNEFIGFVRKNKSNFKKKFELKKRINENDLNQIIENRQYVLNFLDNVYDFSVPSFEINNNQNTYDGSHYYEKFISLIAIFMEGSEISYGLKVNNLDFREKYKKIFFEYYREIAK